MAIVHGGSSSYLVAASEWPIIDAFLSDLRAAAMWHDWLIEAGEEELAHDLHGFRWYFSSALEWRFEPRART